MTQLYCGDCQNYLMGSDGQCHDCSCGWNQPVETYEKENTELETEVARLQKENAELKHINLTSLADLHFKNRDLEDRNAAQAKRIEEHIELIEATAEFSKAFWEKADKHSDTRVMVSTFQQLERKLRTYLPASKNGE